VEREAPPPSENAGAGAPAHGEGVKTAKEFRSCTNRYINNRETENALSELCEGLARYPGDSSLRSLFASQFPGDLEEKIDSLNSVILRSPQTAEAYYLRGLAFKEQDDYPSAEKDFSKYIELISDPPADVFNKRGYIYLMQDNYDAAISDYGKAIQLDPDEADNYFGRGMSYYLKKNYGAAIHDFSKAIKINGDDYFYYEQRGHAYSKKEKYDSAVSDFSTAIDLYSAEDDCDDEELAELYNYRGVAWSYLENYENALADYEIAMRLDPDNDQYKENRKQIGGGNDSVTSTDTTLSKIDDKNVKKVDEAELGNYAKHYDKNVAYRLLKKLRKMTRNKPLIISGPTGAIVSSLGKLLSALDNPATPAPLKALVVGAIGYIVLPIDLIPDFTPVIGYADDLASSAGVVLAVAAYSNFSLAGLDAAIDEEC
jgi:tetratricopeptide (TPR) repeat protein